MANHTMEGSNLSIKTCHEVLTSVLEYWALGFWRNLESLNVSARVGRFVKSLCCGEIFFFSVLLLPEILH